LFKVKYSNELKFLNTRLFYVQNAPYFQQKQANTDNNTQRRYHLSQQTMGVLFIILFYATLHVSAYKQAIFRCLLCNIMTRWIHGEITQLIFWVLVICQ
jgi:hypothetical protein